jgi:hypothetical protein
MEVLFLTNDVNHMYVISCSLLAMSFMTSIKDCFFLHLQELKNSLNRCVDLCLENRHIRLDINSDEDHLILVNLYLNIDSH